MPYDRLHAIDSTVPALRAIDSVVLISSSDDTPARSDYAASADNLAKIRGGGIVSFDLSCCLTPIATRFKWLQSVIGNVDLCILHLRFAGIAHLLVFVRSVSSYISQYT
jgi:hypothetical protein